MSKYRNEKFKLGCNLICRDDVDLHVFLDRNIWQASIMLIDNDNRNDRDEEMTNWDNLDNWGALENNYNYLNNSNTYNKSNATLNVTTRETVESSGLQITDTESFKTQKFSIPNKTYENNESCASFYCPEINEKPDLGSLEEMKDSYVPVLVGSASGSNDIMV